MKSLSGAQGRSTGRGSGERSPPEAKAFLLNKHAIFNAALMKMLLTDILQKSYCTLVVFSKIRNAHLKFLLRTLCSKHAILD